MPNAGVLASKGTARIVSDSTAVRELNALSPERSARWSPSLSGLAAL
jgi:hypothetical protein